MQRPLVSVVVFDFNYTRFLKAAVESALGQSYAPVEVATVDDGSTDDSLTILAGFAGRIALVRNPQGGQVSAAGFAASRREVVIFLDADDSFPWPRTQARHVRHVPRKPARLRPYAIFQSALNT